MTIEITIKSRDGKNRAQYEIEGTPLYCKSFLKTLMENVFNWDGVEGMIDRNGIPQNAGKQVYPSYYHYKSPNDGAHTFYPTNDNADICIHCGCHKGNHASNF
jgi:hypothetical protein